MNFRSMNMDEIGKSNCSVAANDSLDIDAGIGSLITPSELAIRSLGFRDKNYHKRLSWIWSWNGTRRSYEYSDGDLSAFSQIDECFDALALHGDDPRRMMKLLKQSREIYSGKTIAVIASSPPDSTVIQFLNAGADDVFTLGMNAEEAAARFRAHCIRRSISVKKKLPPPSPSLSTDPRDSNQCFTPFEKKLLYQLEKNGLNCTTYWQLMSAIGKPCNRRSLFCLKSSISKLRKKLPESHTIMNVFDEGYILQIEENIDR